MVNYKSTEIRLWWPLPLAAAIWLIIIWGFGFFLASPKEVIVTPPPIEASFVELPESALEKNLLPPPSKGSQPIDIKTESKQKQKAPAQLIPPQPKPKAPEITEPAKSLAEKTKAEVSPAPASAAPTDLTDYINQARARRRAAGIIDGHESTQPPQPSADEIRMARINRNLQAPGTSGIFQITQIGSQSAEFLFRGWTTGQSNTRRVLIKVDAEPDGNIERAIIRRMIKLIRQYYDGDFNWESHRLNRVVILSARTRDSEGLENFLMREFFHRDEQPYFRQR